MVIFLLMAEIMHILGGVWKNSVQCLPCAAEGDEVFLACTILIF